MYILLAISILCFFALVLACAIYAGEPEALVFLAIAGALLVLAVLGARLLKRREASSVLRPALDLVLAGIVGAALGAPLRTPRRRAFPGCWSSVPAPACSAR